MKDSESSQCRPTSAKSYGAKLSDVACAADDIEEESKRDGPRWSAEGVVKEEEQKMQQITSSLAFEYNVTMYSVLWSGVTEWIENAVLDTRSSHSMYVDSRKTLC